MIGRALLIFTLLAILPVMVSAQWVEVYLANPGGSGMQSNFGPHTMTETQVRYSENVDVSRHSGKIIRRNGLTTVGSNSQRLYGLFINEDGIFSKTRLLGIRSYDTLNAGQLCYSAPDSLHLDSLSLSLSYLTNITATHDWVTWGDYTIHCDGMSSPILFVPYRQTRVGSSPAGKISHANGLSLGLEAPGQPRVTVIDSTTAMNDVYVYAFAYNSKAGRWSIPVKPDGNAVAITMLPYADVTVHGTDSLAVLRKSQAYPSPVLLEYLRTPQNSHEVYIDTLGDSSALVLSFFEKWGPNPTDSCTNCDSGCGWRLEYNRYNSCSGDGYDTGGCYEEYIDIVARDNCAVRLDDFALKLTLLPCDVGCDSVALDTLGSLAWPDTGTGAIPGQLVLKEDSSDLSDSTVMMAYSIYDPTTGIESPLGPGCYFPHIEDSLIGCSLYVTPAIGYDRVWYRIYAGVTDNFLPGDDDTNYFYGIWQDRLYRNILEVQFPTLWDTTIARGLDTGDISASFSHNFFRTRRGIVQTRPPYIYGCPAPFFDMELMDGRLWGAGDPFNAERIFFSTNLKNQLSWYVANPVDLISGPRGPVIALDRMEGIGQDALYAFKKNGIYVFGGGPLSLQVQVIESDVGPVSKKAITRYGNDIYFMGQDLRIYVFTGVDPPKWLSADIQNWVDSFFVNETTAESHCRAIRTNMDVTFVNDSSGRAVKFDLTTGVWGTEYYETYIPVGFVKYENLDVQGMEPILLYTDSAMALLKDTVVTMDGSVAFSTGVEFGPMKLKDHNLSIAEIGLELNILDSTLVRYNIYNEESDSLYTDSLTVATSSPNYLRFWPKHHQGKELKVKVYTLASDSLENNIEITGVRFWLNDRGENRVAR